MLFQTLFSLDINALKFGSKYACYIIMSEQNFSSICQLLYVIAIPANSFAVLGVTYE